MTSQWTLWQGDKEETAVANGDRQQSRRGSLLQRSEEEVEVDGQGVGCTILGGEPLI